MKIAILFYIVIFSLVIISEEHAYSQAEFTVGQIQWNHASYEVNNTAATIQVIDLDMNKIAISR